VKGRHRVRIAGRLLVVIALAPLPPLSLPAVADVPSTLVALAPVTPEARGSIYRLHLAVDIAIIAVGAVGTAIPFLMSSTIVDERCPCDRDNVNAVDRHAVENHSDTASTLGDIMVGLAVATPVIGALAGDTLPTFVEDMVVFTEVMAVNGGLVTLAKFSVQRPTPRTYAGDPALLHAPGGYLSFYSGHTSFTFAALSFASVSIGARYRWHLLPWIATGVVGATVASLMVVGGAHFPSDVAMGALAGTVVGVAVPWLHLRTPRRLALVPGPGAGGLALRGRF
jgi:membrane-associated phospholipid phosphatase